jgi:N-ethylmaleimide reductase
MTRSRAIGNLPNPLMGTYYGQRAGAGLIVTEGVSPSPNGLGYARIPGLFNEAQASAWKLVTEAVHQRGGRIVVQLMHTGRVTHVAQVCPVSRPTPRRRPRSLRQTRRRGPHGVSPPRWPSAPAGSAA